MESHSQPMKENVSPSTYQLARDDFAFTACATVAIKGKGEMRMYFVDAAAD